MVDAVGPQRTGVRLSPFSTFLDATDPEALDLNLYIVDKLNDMGVLYVHGVEPRVNEGPGVKPPEDSLEPLRKAFKVTILCCSANFG